ncbi:MAG: hypothetical protein KDA89_03665 [Planctomycetaceae bacterium]|nr:hypothetical protein [Planctomycetaceae bacterium]
MSSFLSEMEGSLESLSDIEGYEFLNDLDAGFEEELKSLGVDPAGPTAAKPGSEEKVMMLAARYAAGLPLWHSDDCYDHGPGSVGNLFVDNNIGVESGSEEDEDFDVA